MLDALQTEAPQSFPVGWWKRFIAGDCPVDHREHTDREDTGALQICEDFREAMRQWDEGRIVRQVGEMNSQVIEGE